MFQLGQESLVIIFIYFLKNIEKSYSKLYLLGTAGAPKEFGSISKTDSSTTISSQSLLKAIAERKAVVRPTSSPSTASYGLFILFFILFYFWLLRRYFFDNSTFNFFFFHFFQFFLHFQSENAVIENEVEGLIVKIHDFLVSKGGNNFFFFFEKKFDNFYNFNNYLGEASSKQVLNKFDKEIHGEVTIHLIRSMLKEIADFDKLEKVWKLKPEFL